MAINFPTSIDTLTNPQSTDTLDSPSHSSQHSDLNDAVEALEAKVGVDSSAVATSLDYKVTNASSSNPGHKHTLANGATDVSATADEINQLDGVEVGGTASGDVVTIDGNQDLTDKSITFVDSTISTNVKCRVYLGTAQENITDATNTKVLLDTENFDVGSDFDTSNNRFVAPVTGYYLICGSLGFGNVVADEGYQALVYVDETEVAYSLLSTGSSDNIRIPYSTIEYVESGQYIELYARANVGVNTVDVLAGTQSTFMAIHLLSI